MTQYPICEAVPQIIWSIQNSQKTYVDFRDCLQLLKIAIEASETLYQRENENGNANQEG